jgi:hypothetical protein
MFTSSRKRPKSSDFYAVHFLVAPLVATCSTGSIGDKLSAGTTAGWIEFHGASLQSKRTMDGVQRTSKRPLQFAQRGIKIQSYVAAIRLKRGLWRLRPSARRNRNK